MEKTISGLNSRGWYRLIKVLFIGAFAIVGIIGLLIIFYSNQSTVVVDNAKTTINCVYPTQHTVTAAAGGLYFLPSDFTNGQYSNFNNNAEIQDACGMTDYVNNLVANARASATGTDFNSVFGAVMSQMPAHLFTVNPVFDDEGGWPYIIGYSLLFLIILIAIAEGSRRIFYYVALGSFKPHK